MTAAVAAALTLLLYHNALQLPLWADDLLQVPWVEATPLRDLWQTVGPYEDYRPLHFSLWRGLYALTDDLKPATLHLLNLVGHGLSSFLVGLLAAHISKRAFIAALLGVSFFGLFPFAYDTVLWVSSFSYPLSLILTVSAVLLYLTARETGKVSLYIPVLLLTALAGFAYEGGVMAGPSVLLAEICLQQRPFSRWSPAVFAASIVPFAVITTVSPAVPTEFLTGLHPIYNLVIALQCLNYPLAPLAQLTGGNAITVLVLSSFLLLAGAAWLSWRRHNVRHLLFGLGWTVLWSLIPLSTQAFNWYRDPPRVFYLSAVGIAVVWASILEQLPPPQWAKRWRVSFQGLLSLILLLPGAVFLHDEVTVHKRISELLWATAREAETTPGTLFINLPGRITFAERRYPLGHEGAIPLPPPTNGELWLAVHSEGTSQAHARALGAVLPPTPYLLEMADADVDGVSLRAATQVVQVRYQGELWRDETSALQTIGRVLPPQEPTTQPIATFSSATGETLLLHEASCRRVSADEVMLEVEWQTASPLRSMPTVFVHWWSTEGVLLGQADGDPLGGLYPFAQWQAGEIVEETRVLKANEPGGNRVTLGIWDPEIGARWQAVDASGERLAEDCFTLPPCTAP